MTFFLTTVHFIVFCNPSNIHNRKYAVQYENHIFFNYNPLKCILMLGFQT